MGWRTGLWLLPFALALKIGAAQPVAADGSPGEWLVRLGDPRLRERILAGRALRTAGAPAARFETVLRSLPEPDSPEQRRSIQELVKQLGDPRYAVRVQASRELSRIGLPACASLEAAARSGDLETRARARQLMDDHLGPALDRARLEAALALGHLGRSESTAWLGNRLAATEGDPLIRVASEAALGGLVPASALLGRGGRFHVLPLETGSKVGPGAIPPGLIHARTTSQANLSSDDEWLADPASALGWECETDEAIQVSNGGDRHVKRTYDRHSWIGRGRRGRAVFMPGAGPHPVSWAPGPALGSGRFSKLTAYGWLVPMPRFPESQVAPGSRSLMTTSSSSTPASSPRAWRRSTPSGTWPAWEWATGAGASTSTSC